jgi:predicted nuclease with TOPRIM domain
MSDSLVRSKKEIEDVFKVAHKFNPEELVAKLIDMVSHYKQVKSQLIEAEKENSLLSSWVKHHQKSVEEKFKENRKLKQRLKEAEKVIDFYADKKKWCYMEAGGSSSEEGMTGIIDDFNHLLTDSGFAEMYFGGKRAREYKEKYK